MSFQIKLGWTNAGLAVGISWISLNNVYIVLVHFFTEICKTFLIRKCYKYERCPYTWVYFLPEFSIYTDLVIRVSSLMSMSHWNNHLRMFIELILLAVLCLLFRTFLKSKRKLPPGKYTLNYCTRVMSEMFNYLAL